MVSSSKISKEKKKKKVGLILNLQRISSYSYLEKIHEGHRLTERETHTLSEKETSTLRERNTHRDTHTKRDLNTD